MHLATDNSASLSRRALWFGFATAAIAWLLTGIADVLITWQACPAARNGGSMESSYRGLYLGFTFALLAASMAAGLISFRNWRRLSSAPSIAEAEGKGRREYMALIGVFISITMGVSIVWLSLPIFLLNICSRER
ncbi:MAG TPA: hypothetical protein VFQ00_07735 [Terriglobales bacterium]|nr:hypothetical protein [Terriglobales bacterium]